MIPDLKRLMQRECIKEKEFSYDPQIVRLLDVRIDMAIFIQALHQCAPLIRT